MGLPCVGARAAAVIGGEEEVGGAAVFGHGLEFVPENFEVVVGAVGAEEIFAVVAGVGPVVGFAEGEEEDAGVVLLDVIERGEEGGGVEDFVVPDAGAFGLEVVEEVEAGGDGGDGEGVVSGVDDEAAAVFVEDAVEDVPGSEAGDLLLEAGLFVEPFEDGGVGVGEVVVGVDALVGVAGEGFGVAGVAEVEAVGDVDFGAGVLIAEEPALLGEGAPEEGEKFLPARIGGGGEKLCFEQADVAAVPEAVGGEEGCVGAAEDFLPAEAVAHDEDDVFGGGRLLGVRGGICEDEEKDDTEAAGGGREVALHGEDPLQGWME